ncbi:MAG: CHC2 zinc finger domain-containing protein [Polyangiaceae bacterium]
MARIAEEEIERIKREISLERLVMGKGVKLKRHGADMLGLCPFHDDHEPSLVVSPEKNLWHCLGACQMGGSVIDWVMKAEGVSYRHALELLRADIPSLEALASTAGGRASGKVVKKATTPKLPTFLERSADDEALLRQVVDYYHETLKNSPEALGYLQKRGLNHPEMIARFRLGFANRTLGYRLPQRNRVAGAELRGRLQRVGIINSKGHEHFNGSLVIPVMDGSGQVAEMYGRKVTERLREGTPKHLYLPGPHHGVWNLDALKASKEIILCESLIDALTFWCAGYRNVTTAYGVEGFTDEHREAFRVHGTERVLIAYDRDEAGDRAAEKLGEVLSAMGIEVMRVLFPKGMDANEYALRVGPAERSLGLVLRQAEWLAGRRLGCSEREEHGDAAVGTLSECGVAGGGESDLSSGASDEGRCARIEASASGASGECGDGDRTRGSAVGGGASGSGIAAGGLGAFGSGGAVDAGGGASVLAGGAARAAAGATGADASVLDAARAEAEVEAVTAATAAEPVAAAIPSFAAEPVASASMPQPTRAASELASSSEEASARPGLSVKGDELVLVFGDRRWRVRGLPNKPLPGSMKVNVLVSRDNGAFHVDTLELYSSRQRGHYTKLASEELLVEERVIKRDLGELLLRIEEHLEQRSESQNAEKQSHELSEAEQAAALELLRDPRLLERIVEDFGRCGVVGEHTNLLLGYLAATSRKLEQPLAVVIQSTSAAGKSSLMEAVLRLMPEEERVQYSAMTGQSLFYMGETNLQHKILAIVEEEGAERASYALKLLQSEGELTIASTGKDPATGRLVTQEYHVEGPVMIFQTTTAVDMDEELLNRCIVLTVDEGREQTRAIHEWQRRSRTLAGVVARQERSQLYALHQNVQRLIRPLFVVNPYAQELRFPDHQTRMRRDHMKYLGLIEAVTLLHQYQRPLKEVEHRGQQIRYIEVSKEDIAVANRLAHEVLGRTLDELPPQTRRLLGLLDSMVSRECERLGVDRADYRFSRRMVREQTGWGDTQLKIHLGRLVEMEYVVVHRGAGHSQRFGYELLYAKGAGDGPFLPGLIDASELGTQRYDENRSGLEANRSGQMGHRSEAGRGAVGAWSVGSRGEEAATHALQNASIVNPSVTSARNSHRGNGKSSSIAVEASHVYRRVAAS